MGNLAALKITACPWSDMAADKLGTIAHSSQSDLMNWAAQITGGQSVLMEVTLAGTPRGFVIWALEQEPSRTAFVMHAAAVDPIRGVDMTETLLSFARDTAARNGASVLRFWTRRAGLVRKMKGRMARHYVMELDL